MTPKAGVRQEVGAERRFLTVPQAAARAGWSVRHFRRILARCPVELPIMKIGGKFFLVETVFAAWLKKQPK